jgi:hypothetical protein
MTYEVHKSNNTNHNKPWLQPFFVILSLACCGSVWALINSLKNTKLESPLSNQMTNIIILIMIIVYISCTSDHGPNLTTMQHILYPAVYYMFLFISYLMFEHSYVFVLLKYYLRLVSLHFQHGFISCIKFYKNLSLKKLQNELDCSLYLCS